MKIIDRYLSAYVMMCLFPDVDEGISTEYIYEVLRTTGSTPNNEVLRNVLNYVRQSDPSDPQTQSIVASYVTAMVAERHKQLQTPKEQYVAKYTSDEVATAFMVLKDGQPVAVAGSLNERRDECINELRKRFPGIRIEEIG